MCRQYTVAEFHNTIDTIRLRLDRPAITTDIIVGFPGETEEDFEQTMAFAKECGFAKIHVFSFSKRENTAAAKLQPQIKPEVIKTRSIRLRSLDEQLQQDFRQQFVGEKMGIIVEDTGPARGRCERYFMVELTEAESAKKGHLVFTTLR